jgi:NADH-quinone oxidoreductase subunit M
MILLLLILVPLLGAIAGMFVPATWERSWALFVTLIDLGLGIAIAASFQYDKGGMQLAYAGFSAPDIWVNFNLGMDAISLWLVLLTVLLMPLAILSSFDSITQRTREYYAWMLVLLAAMLGVFLSRNLIVFYIFFELTLIPMFFIIGIWGGPDRVYAAGKFFLFTFTGSVFTLAVVIFLGLNANARSTGPSFDMTDVIRYAQSLDPSIRRWLLLGLLAGFAVKIPLFPFHTWLPLAHTEAPTAGSVILAGVLLKLGTYGMLRLAVPIGLVGAGGDVIFPVLLQWLGVLCIVGIIYGALVAWVQQDIKKLVAYSSVSHLGFCILGLIAFDAAGKGVQGSVLYMINHGLSTGAMFLVIGMIYERYHTRDIDQLSGLAKRMPVLAFFFVFFVMSSIGLPGLNGFVSEFLTILAAFTSPHLGRAFGSFAALGVILGAVYMLHMTARVIFGPLRTPEHAAAHDAHAPRVPGDICKREIALLLPIALAVVALGVAPTPLLNSILQPSQLVLQTIPSPQRSKLAVVASTPAVALAATPNPTHP